MGVVIDEMVTEIEQPPATAGADTDSAPQAGGELKECNATLSRRLHRIHERKLRLSAD